ncbi:MAG: glycosyltransferase family 39 protein [Dehalococcoidia bacterium]|nr:glycosyltransferase family 39 protein [Dehalococcoidia bacterium]
MERLPAVELRPRRDPGALRLSANYWRPLSFDTFRLIYVVFGDEPLPYHLFSLAVHLASVVLVYALGWRLTKSRLGAAVAALVMAVHPGGFESITWIASLNSAALPLALAGWLAFTRAPSMPESTAARNWWLAASLGLAVVALAYRESVAGIVVAMLLWYSVVERRERLRERETQILAGRTSPSSWSTCS